VQALTEPTTPRENALEIETAQADGTYVVRLRGELDLASCDAVDAALRAAERTNAARIVLDIDSVSFIDSSGLQVILRAKRRSDGSGKRLRITRGSGHVADMFRLTALDMTLPFADSPS
jgi:anti-anti-sigma factor